MAAACRDDAVGLELAVGAGHGTARQSEIVARAGGSRAAGRPASRRAPEHERRHALPQLLVGRHGRVRVDLDDHAGVGPPSRAARARRRWPTSPQARSASPNATAAGNHMVSRSASASDCVRASDDAAHQQQDHAGHGEGEDAELHGIAHCIDVSIQCNSR